MSRPEFDRDIPVVVIAFRRPGTTARVLEAVALARPRRLYAVIDGPRTGRPDEVGQVEQVRNLFVQFSNEHPETEVRTLRSEENLGLRKRVQTGLNEVFEQETRAIILEDDCVPHPDFFPFATQALSKWADHPIIKSVDGSRFGPDPLRPGDKTSYYFSHWFHCWGWATWRRAWQQVDHDMSRWDRSLDERGIRERLPTRRDARYFLRTFDQVASGELDSWAFPTLLSWWRLGGLHVHPRRNLVSNIGFGGDAVHTTDPSSPLAAMETYALDWPLIHPATVTRHRVADEATLRVSFVPTRAAAVRRKLISALNRRLMRRG